MNCPACGYPNPDDASRCRRCPQRFAVAPPAHAPVSSAGIVLAPRPPLVGPTGAATERHLKFFHTDPPPHFVLPPIAQVKAGNEKVEVSLKLPAGVAFNAECAAVALRWLWLRDIADLLSFLHAQVPFPVALGRVCPASFEIVDARVWLVDLAMDLAPESRTVAADLEGLARLAREVLPEADELVDAMTGMDGTLDLLRFRDALAGRPEHHPGQQCECGATSPPLVRFCVRCGGFLVHGPGGVELPTLTVEPKAQADVLKAWEEYRTAPLHHVRLAAAISELQGNPGFDRLVCADRLPRIDTMFYQQEAALRVLRGMRGRALLADEVGLGKTIEAGLVIKELLVRDLVTRILVLCPQSLVSQWQAELFDKFDELLLILGRDVDSTLAWRSDRLIASYASIEERWHAEELATQNFDLVVVDEAHYLNDPANARALATVRGLRKRYFLLLSATPMHDDLGELHNILTLLRPGHVGTREQFLATYKDPGSDLGVRHVDTLRRIVQEVMIRNLRSQVALDYQFPRRKASRRGLQPPVEGMEAYQEAQALLREHAVDGPLRQLLLDRGGVAERLTSSRAAFNERIGQIATRLDRRGQGQLLNHLRRLAADRRLDALVEPKVEAMIAEVRSRVGNRSTRRGSKVVVFSQFNATALMLHQRLSAAGVPAFAYDEAADRGSNERAIAEFYRAGPSVLVCPGEAEQGLNLQFASTMINYDLPWDPMRIEQRIGRIQRLGSKSAEVEIINLVLLNTIEQDIIEILEQKIRMFEAVVGPLQAILGNLEKGEDPQQWFGDIFLDVSLDTETGDTVTARAHCDRAIDEAGRRAEEGDAQVLNTLFADSGEYYDE